MLRGRPSRKVIGISIMLVAATIIAYEPIRHNDFVIYDDSAYITENPHVSAGIARDSVVWAFTKSHSANWHPITWLSHILDCELFGLNPAGHHFVSLMLHIINALLFFWILAKMTGTIWASAFVAGVFALHPLQVDSVAWAAERKTVLSGLFWLLTIAAYIHYTKQPRLGRYVLLFLVFMLCVMTKPVVVTLPLVLLLLDYWPLERVNWGSNPIRETMPARRLVMEKVPLLALSGILSVITFIAQRHGGAIVALEKMPLDLRVANMFVSYTKYIGKMIWPSGLAAFYPHSYAHLSDATVIICALIFILITTTGIYMGRRRKYIATGWLWFIGTLIPTIGLVQAGSQAMANRYMYIPMVGLLIIVAWATKELVGRRPRLRVITAVSAIIVLSAAAMLTRMEVKHWRDSMTLFEYALKVTKNNRIAENGYGCALYKAGRFTEAQSHFSNAVRIEPNYPDALNNFAWLLATGENTSAPDVNKAVELAGRACGLTAHKNPVYLDTLAAAYAAAARFEEAVETANKALNEASANSQETLAGEIRERIELYRLGQRYRRR